jgi:hypothetical protein
VGIPLGPYVIVRSLPVEDGQPHYRVRSSVDAMSGRSWKSDQATETGAGRGSPSAPEQAAPIELGASAKSRCHARIMYRLRTRLRLCNYLAG